MEGKATLRKTDAKYTKKGRNGSSWISKHNMSQWM